jgi:L-serine deaminase
MATRNKKSNRRLLKRKEAELSELKKRQEKSPKIFDVIEEIIKTPYYIRGGDRPNKAKGGRATHGYGKAYLKGRRVK